MSASAVGVDIDSVTALVHRVGNELVLPRWRELADGDVSDKGGGDLVTVVDQAAEVELTAALGELAPHVPVIGEEATAANPALIDGLGDLPAAFVVDPIDGTRAFVDGLADFAVMIALLDHGVPVAGWIGLPALGRLWVGEQGSGAFLNGVRAVVPERPDPPRMALGLSRRRSDQGMVAVAAEHGVPDLGVGHPLWAGRYYTMLAAGEIDGLGYWSGWPWDHAPGTAIVRELGGAVVAADGSDYRATGHSGPLVAAGNRELADRLRAVVVANLRD